MRLEDFLQRRDIEVFSIRIPFADRRLDFRPERIQGIDVRTVFPVGNEMTAVRIDARGQHRAIHLRRSDVGGMVFLKENPILRKLVERRRVLRGHEVGPHAIPDDQHHMFRLPVGGGFFAFIPGAWQCEQQECSDESGHHFHMG